MAYEIPSNTLPIDGGDRSAQSHLDWLHTVVDAVDLGWWFQNRVWSEDTTGALSYAPQNDDSLKVVQTTVASMKVTVKLGAGFLLGKPFRKTSDTTLASNLVAPATHPRIDSVGLNPSTGAVTVYTGAEASSPTAATVPDGIFKAAEIYLRVGSTAIYSTPQSTGGYVQNRRALFYLPGEAPYTSGLTVSGGDFIFDGTSGDITIPADGLSIKSDYAGQFKIDASNTNGYLNFRTGGTTDKLTLGKPGDPITLHGSSHDLIVSGDGETLKSSGPNALILEQFGGSGLAIKTDETLRYTVDEDGLHTWVGSLAHILFQASGIQMAHDYAGRFDFKATNAAGAFGFIPANESIPTMIVAATGVQFVGDVNTTIIYSNAALIYNEGEDQLVINQSGAADGIMIRTNSLDRYRINAAGQHDIWGNAYFHNDVYILGTLYIGGVAWTGGGGDITGYATISLPGTVFEPASSGGSGGSASAEFGSNVLLYQSFLNAADGYCMAPNVLMPLNYNDTQTVYVRVRWSANSTSANQVRFLAYTAPQGEGDAANQTLNTAAAILDSNGTTANQMHVSDWTALPVTGIAAGDAMALRLDRTPTHTDDTLAADVRVHSVDIRYTRGAT